MRLKLWAAPLAIQIAFSLPSMMADAQSCPGSLPGGVDCVAATSNKNITAFSVCAKITNSHASGKAIMIPVGSSGEWSSFRTNLAPGVTLASCGGAPVVTVFSSSASWTVPADFNTANNKLECIGAGGGGSVSSGDHGGGGAGYTKISNLPLTIGDTVSFTIGAGGVADSDGGTTSVVSSMYALTYAKVVGAFGGPNGGQPSSDCSASYTPDVCRDGGYGGSVGGGGGAAGPNGSGKNGGNGGSYYYGGGGGGADGGTSGTDGDDGTGSEGLGGLDFSGAASGGSGGRNGTAAYSGLNGTSLTGSVGSGGGGGSTQSASRKGGNGGLYGGGGGYGMSAVASKGAGGVCVMTYTP